QAKGLLSELGIWPSTNSSVCPHESLNTDKFFQIQDITPAQVLWPRGKKSENTHTTTTTPQSQKTHG
ncbi:hypothetical protein LEMLEM_LOCUS13439, partial [Lemmus lemmus]